MHARSCVRVSKTHRLGTPHEATSHHNNGEEARFRIICKYYLFTTSVNERKTVNQFCERVWLGSVSLYLADEFNRQTMFGQVESSSFKQRIKMSFGNSSHKWLHDFDSISDKLVSAGFKDIRRAEFGDSHFPEFEFVEHQPRWLNSLGFECFK